MESRNSSRRKFIKSTGMVAGVTIIPSKSVWGMCNASGVSGGSRDFTDTCRFEHTTLGRSPGSWTKFLDAGTKSACSTKYRNGRDDQGLKKIHGMFSAFSGGSWNWNSSTDAQKKRLKEVYDVIYNLISTTTALDLGGTVGGTIPKATLDLKSALEGNDALPKHLACMYLNLYFEFIPVPAGYNDAAEYMQHIWGVGHTYYTSNASFISALDDYNDSDSGLGAVSGYSFPASSC